MGDNRVLLLSIKPHYAEMILDGSKSVELRRMTPSAPIGTTVLLYASSPTRALVGMCKIADVDSGRVSTLWNRHGLRCGVSRAEYRTYFQGANKAVAISLKDPRRVREQISLAQLRLSVDGFRPPQSFGYVDHDFLGNVGLAWSA